VLPESFPSQTNTREVNRGAEMWDGRRIAFLFPGKMKSEFFSRASARWK
jgi:hypothetical protein